MTTNLQITYSRTSFAGPGVFVASCRDSIFSAGDSIEEADIIWFAYREGALVKFSSSAPEFAVTLSPGSWRMVCMVRAGSDANFVRSDLTLTVTSPTYDGIFYLDTSAVSNGVDGLGLVSSAANPFNDPGTVLARATAALTNGGQVQVLCKNNVTWTSTRPFLHFPEGLRGRVVVSTYGGAGSFEVESTYDGPFISCPGELGLHVENIDFIGSYVEGGDETSQTAIARVRSADQGGQWDLTLVNCNITGMGTKAIDTRVLSGVSGETENELIYPIGWRNSRGRHFSCDNVDILDCHSGIGFVPMSWSSFHQLSVDGTLVGAGLRILSGSYCAVTESVFVNHIEGADPQFICQSVTDPTTAISVAKCIFDNQPPIFAEFIPGESYPTSSYLRSIHFVDCIVNTDENIGEPARGGGCIDWKVLSGVIRGCRFSTTTKSIFCSTASKATTDPGTGLWFEANSVVSIFATDSFTGVINPHGWMSGIRLRNNVVQANATGSPAFLAGSGLLSSAVVASTNNLFYAPLQDEGLVFAIGFPNINGGSGLTKAAWTSATTFDALSIAGSAGTEDPLFIDDASPDFDLAIGVGSPCIGGGTAIRGVIVTLEGVIRSEPYDIGSFQFGAEDPFESPEPGAPAIAEGTHGTDYVEVALSAPTAGTGVYLVEQDGTLLEQTFQEADFPLEIATAESVTGTATSIRVRFRDSEGFESAWSNTINPTTDKLPPQEAPYVGFHSRANTTLTIAFTSVPGATEMVASRALISAPEVWTEVSTSVDPEAGTYVFTGLSGATGYRLRLAAKNSGGTGPATIVEGCYTLPALPSQPSMSVLYLGVTEILLAISSNGSQSGYSLSKAWSGHPAEVVESSLSGGTTTYRVKDLPEDEEITLSLYAYNEAGFSAVRQITATTKASSLYDDEATITDVVNEVGVRRVRSDFSIGGASGRRGLSLLPALSTEGMEWALSLGTLNVSGTCGYWVGSCDLVAAVLETSVVGSNTQLVVDRELPYSIGQTVKVFIQGTNSDPIADDYYANAQVLSPDTILLLGVEADGATLGTVVFEPTALVCGTLATGASAPSALTAGFFPFPSFTTEAGMVPFICISTGGQTISGYLYADEVR